MSVLGPFKSAGQTSVVLTASGAAVSTGVLPGDGESILIYNATNATVFCDFASATLSAVSGSPYVVPAGGRMIVVAPRGVPMFASALATATPTGSVYFMRGDGSNY